MPQFQHGALPRRKKRRPSEVDGKAKAPSQLQPDSDVEEADITALARANLKEGERLLGDDEGADGGTVEEGIKSRGVCNAPALLQKLTDIEYKVPEGAKRVPWVDNLAIEDQQALPSDVKPKDGVKLESTFLGLASNAVREAYRRLRVMKIPCSRPSDFYAEMLRSDSQMFKVRKKATEEERRIKIVEDRKKSQAAKKFAKKARAKKLEVRAEEKRELQVDIKAWRKRSRDEADANMGDVLDKHGKGKGKGDDVGKGSGKGKKSRKRLAYDKKFGFGGKKKRAKQNDSKSVNDMSQAPWTRKGKGKSGKSGKGGKAGKGGKGGKEGKGGKGIGDAGTKKRRRK